VKLAMPTMGWNPLRESEASSIARDQRDDQSEEAGHLRLRG